MRRLTVAELEVITSRALETFPEPLPDLEIDFEELDLTERPLAAQRDVVPATTSAKSQKITIRIPARVITAFRQQAARTGVPYQRLMNRALRSATSSWV